MAVAKNVEPHLLSFIDVRDNTIASSTMCSIGSRRFLIGAAHTIPEDLGWLSPTDYVSKPIGEDRLVALGFRAHDVYDVAYVELDPKSPCGGKSPMPIDRLQTNVNVRKSCIVVGYPAAAIKPDGNKALTLAPTCYPGATIPQSKWPTVAPEDRKPVSGVDLFIKYDMDAEMLPLYGNCMDTMIPPNGMSGGGLWQSKFKRSVWQPGSAQLVAIQSSWSESRKYLRAIRIIQWLKLIHADYPDLRAELERRFPGLRSR